MEKALKPVAEKVNGNTGELIVEVTPSTEEIVAKVKTYLDAKEKKVYFNGKRYPEFDVWQYIGKFYGVTVKTFDPHFTEIGGKKGFHAKAMLLADQAEIGRAEAYCMDDEPNWRNKPLFQLASMAQTRAAAKAYANLFRPIVGMAGIECTPAEEMDGSETIAKPPTPAPKVIARVEPAYKPLSTVTEPAPQEIDASDEWLSDEEVQAPIPDHQMKPDIPFVEPPKVKKISQKQQGLLFVKAKQAKIPELVMKHYLKEHYGVDNSADLPWQAMDPTLKWIERYQEMAK